jgi:hypothetical protein
MLAAVALSVFSALLVHAQSNPQLEVESIDAQFDAAYIVPDLIAAFDPIAYLTVSYGGEEIPAGSPLTVEESNAQPVITLTPGSSSVTLPDTYTLALVDPGAVGADLTPGPTRHWLVNGVTVGADGTLVIPDADASITPYGGPLPPDTDPAHRYTLLLWEQPEDFAPEGDLANPGQPITQFDLDEYVTSSGLGPIVAGWYFTCQQGDVAPPTTTVAVDTATLPAYGSDSDTAHTTRGTGTGSAPPSSSTGAALTNLAPAGMAGIAAALFGIVLA